MTIHLTCSSHHVCHPALEVIEHNEHKWFTKQPPEQNKPIYFLCLQTSAEAGAQ
jgi:hypothetical protein